MRQVVDVAPEVGVWRGGLVWRGSWKRQPWTAICKVCTLRLQSG